MAKTDQYKILVIEDDIILVNNLSEVLTEEGYLVKTEIDGQSGISSAIDWKPDLIICDISIPSKDGYEVIQEVKKNSSTRSIPFIFLTAKVEKTDVRKGMQLGADDYIFKPFDIQDLLNSITLRLQKLSLLYNSQPESPAKKSYDMDDKIMIKKGIKVHLISIGEIKYLKADNLYVILKFADGKHSVQRESLTDWEKKLPPKYFLRIHRSVIINTKYIVKIEKIDKSAFCIFLKEEQEPFVVSRRFSPKIKEQFS